MTKCIRCGNEVERPGAHEVRYEMPPPAENKVVDYCDRCAPLVPALRRQDKTDAGAPPCGHHPNYPYK